MNDNIEFSDVLSLLISLVLAAQGGVFAKFLAYERSKMTFSPGFSGPRYP